jgi:imidazole glycerol phosphate synthase subunit HisF
VLSAGKDVREVQDVHALLKFVPDEVSINGNEVREEQLYHA